MPDDKKKYDLSDLGASATDLSDLGATAESALPTGSYQTKKGGPILNANAQKPKEGAISRFAGSFNESLGAPRTLADFPSWFKGLTAPTTIFGETAPQGSPLNIIPNVAKGIYSGMKQTSEEANNYPVYSPAFITRKVLSGVPGLGPAIAHGAEQFEHGDTAGALGTVAGLGAGAAALSPEARGEIAIGLTRTGEGLKAGTKATARTVGGPFGAGLTSTELLTKGISPRASAVDFPKNLALAQQDLATYNKASSPIQSVDDLHEAIPKIQDDIWKTEVDPALRRNSAQPVNMKPAADAVRNLVSPEMEEFDAADATALKAFADKLETARDVESANRLLKYANGKLDAYFQKFPAARKSNLLANPETAGWETARRNVRSEFLNTLESAGETGVRDARLRWGALEDVGNEVERRVNVADRQKPMSLYRMLGLLGGTSEALGAIMSGHPVAAAGGLAFPVLGELATRMNAPDALIARGIRKIPFAGPRSMVAPPEVFNPKPLSLAGQFSSASKASLAQRSRAMDVPEWVQGQRSWEIERLKNILRDPSATAEERNYATTILKDLGQ